MHNYVLVYQAGIANVFEVEYPTLSLTERGKTRRLLQHAFSLCEWYAQGLRDSGEGRTSTLLVAHCNMAGDIALQDWSADVENMPFRDQARPPKELLPR